MIVRKTFKYRIYPNKATSEKLQWVLDRCRELYNAALEERKEAYRMARIQIGRFEQQRDLTVIRNKIRTEYKEIGAHVLQDVILRVNKDYQAFFRRVKNDEKPGFPRFKGYAHYNSFTYPDIGGWKLKIGEKKHAKLILFKRWTIKVKMHRPIEGKIKTVTIKREGEHWYVCFACEVEIKQKLPYYEIAVGIDLGLKTFATLSNGETIENPRYNQRSEKKLAKLQRELSAKKRGSHRRKKAVKALASAHRKIRNQRKDFHHRESRKLVNAYQVIVFEDLRLTNMVRRPKKKQDVDGKYLPNGAGVKAGLNKSINDAGWGAFIAMCEHKATIAGTQVLRVNPKNTSQICSACGTKGPRKDLSERTHACAHCGIILDRDHNAALNILDLGYKHSASS